MSGTTATNATDSRFQVCLKLILGFEGGFSNLANDPGGATNLGITQTELNAYNNANGYRAMDVRDISLFRASQIYEGSYWASVHAAYLPPALDVVMFDSAVNCGSGTAIGWLQQVIGAAVTHAFDAQTSAKYQAKIGTMGWQAIAAGVLKLRVAKYHRIGDKGKLHVFEAGWLNRIRALEKFAGLQATV